jgi:hypothetical protein
MSKPGFWVFSPPSGKGVNTRTNNLRVHTAGSDTHTTSVETTALNHKYCFYLWEYKCLRVRPTSVILGKFRIMTTKQSVRGGWNGVATGVQRSQVPLVLYKYAVPLRLVLISSAAHHCQTWKQICCLNSAAVVQVCSKNLHT